MSEDLDRALRWLCWTSLVVSAALAVDALREEHWLHVAWGSANTAALAIGIWLNRSIRKE